MEKPSLRINEIAQQLFEKHKKGCNECGFFCNASPLFYMNEAIIDYLDEEWSNNKPCEHEVMESGNYGMNCCKKCKMYVAM